MINKVVTIGLILTISAFLISCDSGSRSIGSRSIHELFNTQPSGHTLGWNLSENGAGAVFKVAAQVKSAADKLNSLSFSKFRSLSDSPESDKRSCDLDDTAIITIYTTNGAAHDEIDVELDGSPIGTLTSYYPDGGPNCKAPDAEGVITLVVPASKHILKADSPNYTWPRHTFTVDRCECVLLPLS